MKAKKFLSILMSLIMVLGLLSSTATVSFADSTGLDDGDHNGFVTSCGDYDYCIFSEEDKTCEITTYTGSAIDLVIPEELDGYSVYKIDEYVFYDCDSIESVVIPESVKIIGSCAFEGTAYFDYKSNWEDGVLYIGDCLVGVDKEFDEETGALTTNVPIDYEIKEGTRVICDLAFYQMSTLESVTIPDSVESIGEFAFANCTSLEWIEIPGNVSYMGVYAFGECEALKSAIIRDGVTEIATQAFSKCGELEYVKIPDSIEKIGAEAFLECAFLKYAIIPESVTEIGEQAFGYIWDHSEYTTDDNFIIYCCEGSAAEQYAIDNGLNFLYMEDIPEDLEDPDDPDIPYDPDDPDIPYDPDDPDTPDEPYEPSTPSISGGLSLGDLNGDNKISVVDAKWVLQNVAEIKEFDSEQRYAADVNGDGKITVVDAKWILQVVAEIRELEPIEPNEPDDTGNDEDMYLYYWENMYVVDFGDFLGIDFVSYESDDTYSYYYYSYDDINDSPSGNNTEDYIDYLKSHGFIATSIADGENVSARSFYSAQADTEITIIYYVGDADSCLCVCFEHITDYEYDEDEDDIFDYSSLDAPDFGEFFSVEYTECVRDTEEISLLYLYDASEVGEEGMSEFTELMEEYGFAFKSVEDGVYSYYNSETEVSYDVMFGEESVYVMVIYGWVE